MHFIHQTFTWNGCILEYVFVYDRSKNVIFVPGETEISVVKLLHFRLKKLSEISLLQKINRDKWNLKVKHTIKKFNVSGNEKNKYLFQKILPHELFQKAQREEKQEADKRIRNI